MEIVSSTTTTTTTTTTYYAKLKRYWRKRRRYLQRRRMINGSCSGGNKRTKVRQWKIRRPAVKLKLLSPIRLIARLHDGFIRRMIRLAGKIGSSNGGGMDIFGGGKKRVPKAPMIVTTASGKEVVDPKLVMEIYKTMVDARRQLVIM